MVTRVVCSTETPSIYYYKSRHGVDLIRTGPVNKVFWLQRHLWEVKDLRQSQEYRVRASHCFLSLDNIVFKKPLPESMTPNAIGSSHLHCGNLTRIRHRGCVLSTPEGGLEREGPRIATSIGRGPESHPIEEVHRHGQLQVVELRGHGSCSTRGNSSER